MIRTRPFIRELVDQHNDITLAEIAGRLMDARGVRAGITTVCASLRYLPPYSPDLNPIEQPFSKLKALLRKAATRTIPELWQAIADAISCFQPAECKNYFEAAGYMNRKTLYLDHSQRLQTIRYMPRRDTLCRA